MEEVKGFELPTTQKKGALEVNRGLQKAMNHLKSAQNLLNERKETEELTEPEQMMLRNCYFAIGSILVDLGQDHFDEAISAYSAAATRFQDSPDAIQAYRQIARIYWLMDKDAEAEAAINRGKLLLERLKAAGNFEEANPFSPREWKELLDEQKMIL
jgi:tetratricopeptide (TPR) repeat protein